MTDKYKSYLLVFAQFFTFIAIPLTGPIIAANPLLFILEVLAVLLGIWAIMTMRSKSIFNVTPEVNQKALLVKSGPYRYIRHPMYTAAILGFGAMVFNSLSITRLILFSLLVIVHLVKLNFEEHLLQKHFADYSEYQKQTARLVPFIY